MSLWAPLFLPEGLLEWKGQLQLHNKDQTLCRESQASSLFYTDWFVFGLWEWLFLSFPVLIRDQPPPHMSPLHTHLWQCVWVCVCVFVLMSVSTVLVKTTVVRLNFGKHCNCYKHNLMHMEKHTLCDNYLVLCQRLVCIVVFVLWSRQLTQL